MGPAMILVAVIFLGLPVNYFVLIIAYLIPLIVYFHNYQSEREYDRGTNPEKTEYLEKTRKLYPFLMGGYIALLLLCTTQIFDVGLVIFFLIILAGGIMYTLMFKTLTKYVPGFKSVYTTLIWAYYGTFFTIFYYTTGINPLLLFIFSLIFVKMMINVTFFDIKDIETDGTASLRTIPVILGKTKTAFLLHSLNLLGLAMIILAVYYGIIPPYGLGLSIFFLYTYFYVRKASTENKQDLLKYTYLMPDAEFVLWPFVLIVSKLIYFKFF